MGTQSCRKTGSVWHCIQEPVTINAPSRNCRLRHGVQLRVGRNKLSAFKALYAAHRERKSISIDANIRMNANDTNKNSKLIYPELSYVITGICFDAHNRLGRFSREKQYCDEIESKLKELKIPYKREYQIVKSGNQLDFLVENKIILEIKAKRIILKEDFYQLQRYLQASGMKLGLMVNFRNRYLKPIRIVRIDTEAKNKFQ